VPIGKQRWYRGNNSVFVLLYKDGSAFFIFISADILVAKEAAATNVFCSESKAAATNVFCSESEAAATIAPRRN